MTFSDGQENLNAGHRQRMRKRFLKSGFTDFEPHQIIEMLLFYTCPRKDTNKLAHTVLNRFGSIAGVFEADADELAALPGISENAAVLFKMIPECAAVYFSARSEKITYDNTKKLKALFTPCFIGQTREKLYFACFDNDLRLIENIVVSSGTAFASEINVRKIIETAIKSNATLAALAHNHPNGLPTPSSEDNRATRIINYMLKAIGVKLLDHIIVGANQSISMRDVSDSAIFD
ncbi:MAG: hypothetical protein FWG90_01435 [Oscillospiraceae bacterium]|nr:hypothetical protein [Oscillospiraceae bacterium]